MSEEEIFQRFLQNVDRCFGGEDHRKAARQWLENAAAAYTAHRQPHQPIRLVGEQEILLVPVQTALGAAESSPDAIAVS